MINDYVVLDLETTGLNPKLDKIIEIGAVKVRNGEVAEVYSTFVNPGRLLTQRIIDLTGIKDENLKDAPYIEDILPDFLDFLGDDILLGHNLIFDFSFVKKAVVNEKQKFERQGIDTLRIARRFLTDLESKSLGFLCEHYGISLSAHRASNDAIATHKLYQKLASEYYEKEAATFMPVALNYQVKREVPITPRQKSFLISLVQRNGIGIEETSESIYIKPDDICVLQQVDVNKMTKNEASRLIDHLLSNYGR